MIQKNYALLFLLFLGFISPLPAQIDLIGTRYNSGGGFQEVIRWDAISGQMSNVVPTTASSVAIGASVFDARFGNYYFRSLNNFHEVGFNPDTVVDLTPQIQLQSAEVDMNLGKIFGLNSVLTRDSSGAVIATRLDFVEYNIANATEVTRGTIPGVSGFLADGCAFNSNAGIYYFIGLDSTLDMCLYSIPTASPTFTFNRVQFPSTQNLLNSLEYDNDYNKLYSLGSTLSGQGMPGNLRIFEVDPTTATASLEADFLGFSGFALSSNTYDQASHTMTFRTIDSLGVFQFFGWDTFNDSLYALQIPTGNVNEIEADNELYALTKYQTTASTRPIISSNEVKIYPNPSTGTLNVAFENVEEWESLRIYNLLGVELLHFVHLNQEMMTLNLSDLPVGQYFLRLEGKSGQATKRFQILGQ